MSLWISSGITRVSRHQQDKTNLSLLEQEIVSGSGISWAICKCAPRPRHITMPASNNSVFYRPDALPAAQPTASKHWRQSAIWYCNNLRSFPALPLHNCLIAWTLVWLQLLKRGNHGQQTSPPVSNSQFVLAGLYCLTKFGWNFSCCACRVLSPLRNTHEAPKGHYVKTWRHPQNWQYITYCNATRGGPSHKQHAQKFGKVWSCGFRVMRADRQTDILITVLRNSHPSQGRSN